MHRVLSDRYFFYILKCALKMIYLLEQYIFYWFWVSSFDPCFLATKRNIQRKFNVRNGPANSTIQTLFENFQRTGNVNDNHARNVCHPSTKVSEVNAADHPTVTPRLRSKKVQFFCNLLKKQFSIDWFPQCLIKKISFYIDAKNKLQIWTSIQNYLLSKYKHSKSIIKGISKSELWKEQTGWRLGTTFNNNKKMNRIFSYYRLNKIHY